MRALLQRVRSAHVDVAGETIGKSGPGLLVFICAMQGDTSENVEKIALKISKLRIFGDQDGRMNRSILDVGGSALVISQFTLGADLSRGNRPGFGQSARPELAKQLYQEFVQRFGALGVAVETGRFGADMQVHLINDGPVTMWLDV